ncbi:hypothetical protein CLAFUW4_11027 [Fulvia fulva]|uniref:Uncharacterized protein n=1 Tax=Passalora fulva TaxID=5499 RepID=A0A9Q8URL6_PASFU|nr:uncharacterized protein CLAFUR5_10069 [Fulvia fulva]KAK4619843.1 hypothetical protein CLAFUR4_11032 [Fulvia fulva]KAK4620740.1 hypothetical protein CLAFUR0_11038 [Fulvia fulva]UJO19855.1 hypothetical protein CLAFUR5_10069 [Fulvia fulva]WPV17187.1 hypothetical protein CLAFUW4_11027 [Fulvia fulva]WPV32560.1 hypothetical protein CLAFUW7_11024 [Fulvia fulva]
MKFTLFTLTAIASSTLAAPLAASPIAPNTATCDYKQCSEGNMSTRGCFKVHIGRDFINGQGCGPIKNTISKHTRSLGSYKCTDDGAGQTVLEFMTEADRFDSYAAIEALQEAYPMVPFIKNRICLQTGMPVPDCRRIGWFRILRGWEVLRFCRSA